MGSERLAPFGTKCTGVRNYPLHAPSGDVLTKQKNQRDRLAVNQDAECSVSQHGFNGYELAVRNFGSQCVVVATLSQSEKREPDPLVRACTTTVAVANYKAKEQAATTSTSAEGYSWAPSAIYMHEPVVESDDHACTATIHQRGNVVMAVSW